MLSQKKKLGLLLEKSMEVMADLIREKVPESGPFQKACVTFTYPDAPFKGLLWAEKYYKQDNGRCLSAGIHQIGDDRLVSNYICTGTNAELLLWLEDNGNLPVLTDTFEHLKARAADFDD